MISSIRDGQYKLNEFVMIEQSAKTVDCGKALDLTPVCVKANIYESIHNPTILADFEFYDAKGMFNSFIFTNKKIIIDFNTNEQNPKSAIRYELYVHKAEPAISSSDDKATAYKLSCVSEEAWKSVNNEFDSLSEPNIECERMVKAYLNLIESKKDLFAEKTRGLHAFNFTLKKPFECIDEIRVEYAMSQDFKGHAFCFFENKYGFVFKSIEALIKEGKKNVGDKCFMQSTLTNTSIEGAKWRNILAFKAIQVGNEGLAQLIGAGNNIVRQKNAVTGEYDTFEVDPKNLEFETLNEKSSSSTLVAQNERGKRTGKLRETHYDPLTENAERAEKKNHLPYYMAHFLTIVSQITIYGDSTITAGDVIRCQLPEYDGLTRGEKNPVREDSSITTGNYLVTKCRHVLTFNEKAEYMQGLEIVKDGIGGLPQVHN